MPSPKTPSKPNSLAADLDDPFGAPLTSPADLDDPFGEAAPCPSSTSITSAPARLDSIPVDIDPLDEPAPAAPTAPSIPPPPPPVPTTSAGPNAPSILVVDDDPSIRTMVSRALGLHYTVYEASDGIAALEALAQLPNLRAMVCDVMMPRLDGLEVAKKMKADRSLPRIPIIFLTAKDGAFDVVEGINAGARHYLVKPFKVKELLEKVASVVGGSAHTKAR